MPAAAHLPPAPLWRRLAAFGIDALAMIIVTIVLAVFIAIAITVAGGSELFADRAAKILPWLVWWGYYGRGQWLRGGTLGEMAMRIAVVSCHGGHLGPGRVALRALLMLLLFWTLPAAFFSATRQTPYDRLSGVRTVLRQRSYRG